MLKLMIVKIIIVKKGRFGINIVSWFFFINNTAKQNTNAKLEIFEPIEFPTASMVLFCKADSIEIKISGADVAIPIKKKLAIKPEIESFFENSSVDVIRRFAP